MNRQVKCESCDEYFAASRSRCPHCGAKRQASAKRAGSGSGGPLKDKNLIIGIVVILILIIVVVIVLVQSLKGGDEATTGDASPTPSGGISEVSDPNASPIPSSDSLFPTEEIPAEAITLNNLEFNITVGSYFVLEPILTPLNATSEVLWSSADPSIASVNPNDGTVSGLAEGTTTITAFAGSVQSTCTVTVYAQGFPPSGSGAAAGTGGGTVVATGKLSSTDFTLSKSGSNKLDKTYTLKLDGHTDGEYVSSDPKVATVSDNGVVTAVGKGHAVITVTYNGATYKADVYVKN